MDHLGRAATWYAPDTELAKRGLLGPRAPVPVLQLSRTPGCRVTEELDEFPRAFADDEIMPWERDREAPLWLWGLDRGKRLDDIESKELVRKRKWLERDPAAFVDLIQAIDQVLTERGGE